MECHYFQCLIPEGHLSLQITGPWPDKPCGPGWLLGKKIMKHQGVTGSRCQENEAVYQARFNQCLLLFVFIFDAGSHCLALAGL